MFVNIKIAKLAKEAGFKEKCFGYYNIINEDDVRFKRIIQPVNEENIISGLLTDYNGLNLLEIISTPLYDQVIKWFDDKEIYIESLFSIDNYHGLKIYNWKISTIIDYKLVIKYQSTTVFPTKYKALEEAIYQAFKILKN